MKRLFLFCLLLPRLATADCPNAVRLDVGATVTDCSRIGLSSKYNEYVVERMMTAAKLEEKLVDFTHRMDERDTNNEILRLQLKQRTLERDDEREKSSSKLGFILGILIGGAAVGIGAAIAH